MGKQMTQLFIQDVERFLKPITIYSVISVKPDRVNLADISYAEVVFLTNLIRLSRVGISIEWPIKSRTQTDTS